MSFDAPVLDALLDRLRHNAVQRDRSGGHAAEEKAAIADAGLLSLSIPRRYGGEGLAWSGILAIVRKLATVDSALAHLLAFHHLQVATVLIYGDDAQQGRWLPPTVEQALWWGNAVNPKDDRLLAQASAGGYRLDGEKRYCSGARGASWLTLSARDAQGGLILGVVNAAQPGISVRDDWNAIGQRQTDSGSVRFEAVPLHRADLLRAPDTPPTVRHTIRTCLGQLILVNLYAGLAQGALAEARALPRSPAQGGTPDTALLARFGAAHVQASTSAVMADRAAAHFDALWAAGEAVTPEQRREAAVAIAEAKVVAHRASLRLGEELFELGGARSTHGDLALDRFWRNARTHTLHDPIDQKLASLGLWLTEGEFPPGFYQ